jgi:hypothetical protein
MSSFAVWDRANEVEYRCRHFSEINDVAISERQRAYIDEWRQLAEARKQRPRKKTDAE